MARSIQEIANDLRQAIAVMANTNADIARKMGGTPPVGAAPKIEVRLDDGRIVELGALGDELVTAAAIAE